MAIEQYRDLMHIGGGMTALVFSAINRATEQPCSLKVVLKKRVKTRIEVDLLLTEKAIGEQNTVEQRTFMVHLISSFVTPGAFVFVQELCEQNSLSSLMSAKRLKTLSATRVRSVTACLLSALTYLHEGLVNYVYCDLKPCNVLVTAEGYVKLADFGATKKINLKSTTFPTGTPMYSAPELVSGKPEQGSDLFSLGVLVHVLRSAKAPYLIAGKYVDPSFYDDYAEVMEKAPIISQLLSPIEEHFVVRLIQPDINNRLTLVAAKEHSFFQNIDFENLASLPPPFAGNFEHEEEVEEELSDKEEQSEESDEEDDFDIVTDIVLQCQDDHTFSFELPSDFEELFTLP